MNKPMIDLFSFSQGRNRLGWSLISAKCRTHTSATMRMKRTIICHRRWKQSFNREFKSNLFHDEGQNEEQ